MNPRASKPKPRRFTTNAKVLTTTAAVATLVTGWNTIAHWDNAQADNQAGSQTSSQAVAAASALTPARPTATVTPTVAPGVSAESLGLVPIPTLSPLTDVFTQALQAAGAGAQMNLNLPAVAALPALPALEPLPALPAPPSLPAAPQVQAPNSSNQGSSSHATSGGS